MVKAAHVFCLVLTRGELLSLRLGNREGEKKEGRAGKRSRALCDSAMTRSGTRTTNVIIFGVRRCTQCLLCAKPTDQGLPEKNVALLIRKEQRIMSN